MKKSIALALVFAGMATAAYGSETCEQMKARVEKQAIAHHVKSPVVTIVDKGAVTSGKVVAHCAMGKKSIVIDKAAPSARAKS